MYWQTWENMVLSISSDVKAHFLELQVLTRYVKGVKVERESAELEKFREQIVQQVKASYTLESLKEVPLFRTYRNFFWRVGIDPTKIRPAAEALIRRILADKPLPKINTVVDAYNLASIKTGIALAAFDEGKLTGNLLMRFAKKGEKFLGIGMEKPMELEGVEVVISDEEKLVAIYPYRDADCSKVSDETRDILLLMCGVPGIGEEILQKAADVAIEYITRFCGGDAL